MIPVANSLLYVQPLYVESARNQFPVFQLVIAVYGNQVAIDSTLSAALTQVFAGRRSRPTPGGTATTGALSPQVRSLLDAGPDPVPAVPDRSEGRQPGCLPDGHHDHESDLEEVQQLTGGTVTPTTTTTTTTTEPGSAGSSGSSGSSGSGSSG